MAAIPTDPPVHEVSWKNSKLNLPDEIFEISHKFYPWETNQDVDNAESYYNCVIYQDEEADPKIDYIKMELTKLKDLSSILRALADRDTEVCIANEKRAALPFHELVEQIPSIADIPCYGHLTTNYEKFQIQKALEYKLPKDKILHIEVSEQSLQRHLELLREKLQKINDECWKADRWTNSCYPLLSRVNYMIGALERAIEQRKISKIVKELEGRQYIEEDLE